MSNLIIGAGGYLPAELVTNNDLAAHLDTSDAWIVSRTGITKRHRAADNQKTSDLAAAAAQSALDKAGIGADAINGIIVATATADRAFPATAAKVQAALGIRHGFAFDVSAACAGFIAALLTADGLLSRQAADCMLVIGAETFMRLLDPNDRSTAVLFGDGAGAVVLRADDSPAARGRGLLSGVMNTDGRLADALYLDERNFLRMNGREVFRHAVGASEAAVRTVLKKAGLEPGELAALVPHQANLRISDALTQALGLPPERTVNTIGLHANTSAASIPLAWSTVQDNFVAGDAVAMVGMGAGFTAGAAVFKV